MGEATEMDDWLSEIADETFGGGSPSGASVASARFPVGSRARIIGNSNNHNYLVGSTIEITTFDENDRTYQARSLNGRRNGNWLNECDLASATELDWAWLQTALPEEDVLLLRAFDGVERLTLSPRIRDTLVSRVPGLKSAILRALPVLTGGADAG